ncbi:hypothetical protein [Leadbetterella byssophila]|uniref:hypothetical protein n=1 Tax=Leadbetterella byssophila TaxID=316068 RepID=UPI0039A23351
MKELDELFKKTLAEAEYAFREEDWELLEPRLPKKRNKLILLPWAAAIILVGAFLWIRIPHQTTSKKEEFVTNKTKEKERYQTPTLGSKELDLNKVIAKSAPKIDRKPERKIIERSVTWDGPKDISVPEPAIQLALKPLEPKSFPFPVYIHPNFPEGLNFTESTFIEVNDVPKKRTNWGHLGLIAGPDLTSVRGAGQNSLSANVGLAYTYPLTKRWSVSAGAFYSRKNYKSPYSFYSTSSKGYYDPTDVKAICEVLSVPVGINYTLWNKKDQSFQLNAGASSYFMLKEKYTMKYEHSPDKEYVIKGENQHYFGVIDLAVTYSKKNWGIRPFYQIPITGIGYGNIPLQSGGVALIIGLTHQ